MGAYALVVSRSASACGVPRVIPLGIPVASTEHARAPPFRTLEGGTRNRKEPHTGDKTMTHELLKSSKDGFTLIELILGVAGLAILFLIIYNLVG